MAGILPVLLGSGFAWENQIVQALAALVQGSGSRVWGCSSVLAVWDSWTFTCVKILSQGSNWSLVNGLSS